MKFYASQAKAEKTLKPTRNDKFLPYLFQSLSFFTAFVKKFIKMLLHV